MDQAEPLRCRVEETEVRKRISGSNCINLLSADVESCSYLAKALGWGLADRGWRTRLGCMNSDQYFRLATLVADDWNHPLLNIERLDQGEGLYPDPPSMTLIASEAIAQTTDANVIVLSPDQSAVKMMTFAESIRRTRNIKDFGVVSVGVRDGWQGVSLYRDLLKEKTIQGCRLNYLAHLERKKTVLESRSEVALLIKRLVSWKLDLERPEVSAIVAAARFRDEP